MPTLTTPSKLTDPVQIGGVAHGGYCVARIDGRVVFVRHALPGETAKLCITDDSRKSFWFADAVEILEPHPQRVTPICPVATAGGCGGCDWQHASDELQLELKRTVVAEQLRRMAGIDWDGSVEPVIPKQNWRTRMRYWKTGNRWGMRKSRSHEIVPLPESGCAISHVMPNRNVPGEQALVVASETGTLTLGEGQNPVIQQRIGQKKFDMDATGFWQSHLHAPELLTDVVIKGLNPKYHERAYDLYCGVGPFAHALTQAGCIVTGIEGNKAAVKHAKKNVPNATFLVGDVGKRITELPPKCDLIVLDPPRTGAGMPVMTKICRLKPRKIAYVACDPVALARDLNVALTSGYQVEWIRAFDLFPQTHHVETVVLMTRIK